MAKTVTRTKLTTTAERLSKALGAVGRIDRLRGKRQTTKRTRRSGLSPRPQGPRRPNAHLQTKRRSDMMRRRLRKPIMRPCVRRGKPDIAPRAAGGSAQRLVGVHRIGDGRFHRHSPPVSTRVGRIFSDAHGV
jgi:hypothetical protein